MCVWFTRYKYTQACERQVIQVCVTVTSKVMSSASLNRYEIRFAEMHFFLLRCWVDASIESERCMMMRRRKKVSAPVCEREWRDKIEAQVTNWISFSMESERERKERRRDWLVCFSYEASFYSWVSVSHTNKPEMEWKNRLRVLCAGKRGEGKKKKSSTVKRVKIGASSTTSMSTFLLPRKWFHRSRNLQSRERERERVTLFIQSATVPWMLFLLFLWSTFLILFHCLSVFHGYFMFTVMIWCVSSIKVKLIWLVYTWWEKINHHHRHSHYWSRVTNDHE